MTVRSERLKRLLQVAVWPSVLLLLWFALRDVSWPAVLDMLGGLGPVQLGSLLGINALIILLLAARWWLILRTQGYQISLLEASAYRLAAFGVSYLTPGPHFGGEPVQVYMVHKRHGVPIESATASIALDRLLELCANFAFLIFGLAVLVNGGLFDIGGGIWALAVSLAAFSLPLLYLGALAAGRTPFSAAAARFTRRGHPLLSERFRRTGYRSEIEAGLLLRRKPAVLFQAVLLSILIWALLVFEYVLLLRFLGLQFDIWQVISVITGARLAILLPFPAGLGALETALILVTRALGEAAAVGAGIGLVIRVRDLIFSLAGLGLGAVWMSSREPLLAEERSQKIGQGS